MILTLDSVLSAAGVDFWLDTLVTKPVMEGLRLRGVRVENKSGSGRLDAHCLIDCTGDADVAFRAGAPCGYGENRLVIWAYQVSMERARQCVARNDASHLLKMTVRQRPNPPRGEAGTGRDDPFGGKAVSQFVLESRSLLRDYYVKRQRASGKNRVYPIRLPGLPHFRTSRRIEGLYTLGAADAWMQHEDAVGLMADWRGTGGRQNDVWELPYRCLLPQRVSGLLVAGRCISSDGDAWEITRAIGSVVLQGEVAGVAAALSVQNSCPPRALDPRAIRKVLGKRGVPCGLAEIYSADEMEKNRPKGKNA
jgi:hypothetical protein